jgi:hypothetical protein
MRSVEKALERIHFLELQDVEMVTKNREIWLKTVLKHDKTRNNNKTGFNIRKN